VCESTFDVQIGSVNNVKHPKRYINYYAPSTAGYSSH